MTIGDFTKKKLLLLVLTLAILFLVIGSFILFFGRHSRELLPARVVTVAGFPVYCPSPMPQGFAYKSGSANFEDGVVFYELLSGDTVVHVSEQRKPTNLPKLDTLSGHPLETPVGKGTILSGDGNSAIIITTGTTLITISSSTPSATLSPIAENMRSLN